MNKFNKILTNLFQGFYNLGMWVEHIFKFLIFIVFLNLFIKIIGPRWEGEIIAIIVFNIIVFIWGLKWGLDLFLIPINNSKRFKNEA